MKVVSFSAIVGAAAASAGGRIKLQGTGGDCLLSNDNAGKIHSDCELVSDQASKRDADIAKLQQDVSTITGFLTTAVCPAKMTANMDYDATGSRTLHGLCRYVCEPDHHDQDSAGACMPCKSPDGGQCEVGFEVTGTCSTETDTTCAPCTSKPAASIYSSSGTCDYDCTGGFDKAQSALCDTCADGYHDADGNGICDPCLHGASCAPGYELTGDCSTAVHTRACTKTVEFCPAAHTISNGQVDITGRKVGDTATITCDGGTGSDTGDMLLTCDAATAAWTTASTCQVPRTREQKRDQCLSACSGSWYNAGKPAWNDGFCTGAYNGKSNGAAGHGGGGCYYRYVHQSTLQSCINRCSAATYGCGSSNSGSWPKANWNHGGISCTDNECGGCVHGCHLYDDPTGASILASTTHKCYF
jgi:hypothetical protein